MTIQKQTSFSFKKVICTANLLFNDPVLVSQYAMNCSILKINHCNANSFGLRQILIDVGVVSFSNDYVTSGK